ncbi:acyltransferase [Streptomyces sp. ME18-1-4]|uniref:acyltransferase family protein n=1 Tax=Streptomyces sp. ME18-1-4 TaxID=3028685 RepID=UPI0029A33CFF|nr:acyltransferase [Streptomyces sp. ME18-1-4]MDX3246930.1 acyltransferase [Streptomyces sp. ME18-1-4]
MTSRISVPSAAARFGWLDVVRGIAALTVALHHLSGELFVGFGADVRERFDPGIFGVVAFFLVSGYIVPASLERRGDVRAFWTGRLFRLYPLCAVVFIAAAVLVPQRFSAVAASVHEHPVLAGVANATMLQDLLGLRSGLPVMWTLTYEMVFYYLVTLLFMAGAHRRSGPVTVVFAAAALLLGPWAATWSLRPEFTVRQLVAGTALVVVVGLLFLLTGRRSAQLTGATLLTGLGLVLMIANGRSTPWESMLILATMFSGTVIYRAERGQIRRGAAWAYCGFVLVAGTAAGLLYNDKPAQIRTWTASPIAWVSAFLAGWLLFAVALLLRHRRMPAALTWLGLVSFSVYLLHRPLIAAMSWLMEAVGHPHGLAQQLFWVVAFLSALLMLSALTYHLVELPGQRLGRRLLDRRSGPPAESGPVVSGPYEVAAQRGRHRLAPDRSESPVGGPSGSQVPQ